ncbi:hypothetical protein HG536_0A08890 [Torulaspora globosa]|uniref:O-acyltransferase n=1 Tax=Torulaspora globosa TaxID=48254 RepID=A0A7G3ZC36_9SACH|nr:uncharacterized protein HG536_0A08890 [Torulaspora globosa]QLL31072.1 hypothetical protein HG536_0A08890 [Torulaspora globosa]
MSENLLENEQFKKIQKLNSVENRRQSIIVDDIGHDDQFELSDDQYRDQPAEEDLHGAKIGANEGEFVTIGDNLYSGTKDVNDLPLESTEAAVVVDDSAQSVVAKTSEKNGDELIAEPHFEIHLKQLHSKEKLRFRRHSNQKISYFGDVAFDCRPSVIDGTISEQIRTKFEGPTLEKQIKEAKTRRGNPGADGAFIETETLHPSFTGFYILFWMAVAFSCVKVFVNYYREHDGNLRDSEILKFMTTDLVTVAWVDLLMYLSTYFVFGIHWLCRRNFMKWSSTGFALTSIYEFGFVIFYMLLTENVLKLHWVAKIFLFLHSLVLLMKMHSFAFYNGYLWNISDELKFSKNALAKYKDTAGSSVIATLERSRDFCSSELESQSSTEPFPQNINLKNYFVYTMFPTLVYQIKYPRTKRVRWDYVFEKLCAIFGTIFVMMLLAQTYMYPLAIKAISIRDSPWTSLVDKLQAWCFILVDYIPAFIAMYLLTFYLIWDAILNCIAELTRFGDRYFYGDWWNCVSWDEFSRLWNVPVHKFLLRHVYHSSMSALQLNKNQATLMTFFLSAIVHELAMYVLFKRLRVYLFFFQMNQLPLVALSNSRFLRKRTVLGNVLFWIGICTGPSMLCSLYLTI